MDGELTISPDSIYNPLEELKKKQEDELIRLKAERDAAEKAYQESLSSGGGRNIWEQLLVGLAPMALGAALGGDTGLGSGALGSRAGIRSYEDDADRRAKEEAFIAKSIFGTADKGYQNALDAQLGLQSDLAKSQVGFNEKTMLQAQKDSAAMERALYGAGGKSEMPADPATMQLAVSAAQVLGVEPPLPGATRSQAEGYIKALETKQKKDYREQSLENQKDATEASKLRYENQLKKTDYNIEKDIQKLESNVTPGFDWIALPQTAGKKELKALQKAHYDVESAYSDLEKIVEKNKGFVIAGGNTAQEKAQYNQQKTALARLTLAIKNQENLGAAFTGSEQVMVAGLSGAPAATESDAAILENWITNSALNRDPLAGLKNARQALKESYANQVYTGGAIPKGDLRVYGSGFIESLKRDGIQINEKTGQATYKDALTDAKERLSSYRAGPQPTVRPVATNAQQTGTSSTQAQLPVEQRYGELRSQGLSKDEIRERLIAEGFKVK